MSRTSVNKRVLIHKEVILVTATEKAELNSPVI